MAEPSYRGGTCRRYEELKAHLSAAAAGGMVSESVRRGIGAASGQFDERVVQAIWQEQLLDAARLETCSGKSLRVIDPGKWNGEAGPDFLGAELEIGGRRMRGDVEIHVHSADWEKHLHHRDFEYNTVILHAFLRKSGTAKYDTLHNGAEIERVELEPVITPDFETACRSLSVDDYPLASRYRPGRCHPVLMQLGSDFAQDFFASAARERMEAKIARFAAQGAGESEDQVLYQAVMTAMGYKGGKTLFFLLAKRTPLAELADYLRGVASPELPVAIESVLLNVANLVPAAPTQGCASCAGQQPLDEDTQAHLNRLNRWWSELSGYYTDRIIPPTRRWFGSVRPVNFPTRRAAGVARLLANYDFRRGLLRAFTGVMEQSMQRNPQTSRDFKREIANLAMLFETEDDSYWSTRFTFGGKESTHKMQLIGEDRAASILFNALLPMLLLHARKQGNEALEAYLWRLFEHFPALPENATTKFMRQRLFADVQPPFMNFRFEKSNQALFQVFHDCCNNNALTCDDCVLYRCGTETG